MDIRAYNRRAWDLQVREGKNRWTIPVGPEVIERARQGEWSVLLTDNQPVPADWFPPLPGLDVLCLACGGGQQGPVFAAAGANVTVLDNSPAQLGRDRQVAERDGLDLRTIEGDMADLSVFVAESFDLVFNPVSTVFIPDVLPVWREAYRVLRPGGTLLAGVMNPDYYLFDYHLLEQGQLQAVHRLPYADADDPVQRADSLAHGWPLEFSHTLTDLIGGQLEAGFHLIGLYVDHDSQSVLGQYFPSYLATRAVKP